ncbi:MULTISPECIES: hypothetical protein [Clostridium]|jgi:hypothetical protein|uniref:Uncharacterized protein n=1 Tax=Clostridium saccharoperbutylacetonicum N1-4(HMT) TaxID=931276 RepID=M1MFZ0_9CLOT|nr:MULTISPECIES: hypothetical protein [Clostridium]AGF53896.1 hypothetical protein Cspa_c00610 [Clostridium saccharoperbutylacetonicum N1-4(HMT)]AQR92800.1 hypothetical protein CLSAP_00610 [Clostridium saccharoperbutylacetonicum]NRT59591.1 hypothetical protein [Clostridium saccharoperbutylacetonicum]NSB28783.1 hypothetical protein [Clostridium saccharoperbutylacetonicum]NSB34211.1 hypothetical protein [Clostridium saccharoperbutylacetonicum]
MDNSNLKIAQQDVEEALKAVEEMEKYIHTDSPSKEQLKEKFICLSNRVQNLETILMNEGIL